MFCLAKLSRDGEAGGGWGVVLGSRGFSNSLIASVG